MAFAKPSLKGRALRLLSQREHSRAELERKLAAHEEEPGALALALDDLQAKGFISEARVVESVIHRRAAKLGAMRIRMELQEKGLDPELVEQAVNELGRSELARASEVWRKKYRHAPDTTEEKARQARYLTARGFAGEIVLQVLKKAGQREQPDAP
jgi:regulatory protein